MRVHHAYFGDKNGSHNLIASSIDDRLLIGHLKLNTDIPASINVSKPYLSAFKFDQYYILTKTMNDESSERPGMGFSHCIIVPLELLLVINNLRDIIDIFVEYPVKNVSQLEDIEIEFSEPAFPQFSITFHELVFQLSQNTGTVVYLGYDNFEEDIVNLWKIIPYTIRQNLSFTISGSPNEIENEAFTIVHTPHVNEIRWTQYPMVKGNSSEVKNIEFNKLLVERESPGSKELFQFINDNNIEIKYIHQYPAIVKLLELTKKAVDDTDIFTLKRIIKLLSEIIPVRESGATLKNNLFTLFLDKLKVTDAQGALSLRNMNFAAFDNGEIKVFDALTKWAENFINPDNSNFFPHGIKVINEAYFENNPNWWSEIIRSGLNKLTTGLTNKTAIFLWKIWQEFPKLISHTVVQDEDQQLLFKVRKVQSNQVFYEELSKYSRAKGWLLLYADAVSHSLPAKEAILSLVQTDNTLFLEKHLEIIKENIGDSNFFYAALSIDNATVHKIAGQLAAKNTVFLHNVDVQNLNWQKVWYESYLLTIDISSGINDLKGKLFDMISLVLERKAYKKSLLEAIATKDGNVFDHPRRKEIWKAVDKGIAGILLDRTGEYVISNLKAITWEDLEIEIRTYIQQAKFIDSYIINGSLLNIKEKVEVLEKINRISNENVIEVLKVAHNVVNYFEAEYVSSVINTHKLKGVLDYVYANRTKFHNFSIIVERCKSMLSLWNQMWLKSSSGSISIQSIKAEIDNQNLQYVFKVLGDMGIKDKQFNRLRDEYIAGVKGIDLLDLCNRLKTYVSSLG